MSPAGSVLGKGSSSHVVMAVSRFDWGRLLKPDQARMPFFADMLPSARSAPHVHAAIEAVSQPRTATMASEDLLSKVRAMDTWHFLLITRRHCISGYVQIKMPVKKAGRYLSQLMLNHDQQKQATTL